MYYPYRTYRVTVHKYTWYTYFSVHSLFYGGIMKAQYGILRFAKYKGPEIGHIEAHNERTKEKYASNPDVDTSRSQYNFHLITPQRKYRAEAEKQIAEAGCRTRSDSVRVVEALVTASPDSSRERNERKSKNTSSMLWISSRSIRQKKRSFPQSFTWT